MKTDIITRCDGHGMGTYQFVCRAVDKVNKLVCACTWVCANNVLNFFYFSSETFLSAPAS